MKKLLFKPSFFLFVSLFGILIQTACDRFKEDVNPGTGNPNANILITKANRPVIKDITKLHSLSKPATFSLKGQPKYGEAKFVKAGLLMYSPNKDVSDSTDLVNYEICIEGVCETKVLTIKILAQGVEPEGDEVCEQGAFADIENLLLPNNELIINVLENDTFCLSDADAATLEIITAPALGTASIVNGKIRYQINPNDFTGGETDIFSYQVAEKGKPENIKYAAVVVNIKSFDCELVTKDDKFNLALPNNELRMKVLENDEFCSSPREFTNFKILWAHPNITANISNDEIIVLLNPLNFEGGGTINLTYQVAEANKPENIRIANVTINLLADPDPCNLIVKSDVVNLKLPNNQLNIKVLDNDVFCKSPKEFTNFKITDAPSKGTATISGSEIIYQINPNDFFGNEIMFIGYQVAEKNKPNKIFQTYVQVNFEPANCNLIVRDDEVNVEINSRNNYINVWNNDTFCKQLLHADTLEAFKIVSPPAHGEIYERVYGNGSNYGFMYYQPDLDYEGVDQVTYQTKYKDGTTRQGVVRINISGGTSCKNAPPQAQNDTYTFKNTDFEQFGQRTAPLYILENDALCYPAFDASKAIISQNIPSNQGTLEMVRFDYVYPNGAYIHYKLPNPTFTGTVVFKYQICDKYNRCSEATVTLNITD